MLDPEKTPLVLRGAVPSNALEEQRGLKEFCMTRKGRSVAAAPEMTTSVPSDKDLFV